MLYCYLVVLFKTYSNHPTAMLTAIKLLYGLPARGSERCNIVFYCLLQTEWYRCFGLQFEGKRAAGYLIYKWKTFDNMIG